jgi:hypothetical protein
LSSESGLHHLLIERVSTVISGFVQCRARVRVEFNRVGTDWFIYIPSDRGHKWVIFGVKTLEEKRDALKVIERLSGGSESVAKSLDGLEVFCNGAATFLYCGKLKIYLHGSSTGLRCKHGKQSGPESCRGDAANCMNHVGFG